MALLVKVYPTLGKMRPSQWVQINLLASKQNRDSLFTANANQNGETPILPVKMHGTQMSNLSLLRSVLKNKTLEGCEN